MKKYIFSFVIICVCLLTVGCLSNKATKVTCSTTTSGIEVSMNFTYLEGKKMYDEKGSLLATMDLSKYNETQINALKKQDFCAAFLKGLGRLEAAFANCEQQVTSEQLKLTADVNMKTAEDKGLFKQKIDKEDIEKYFSGYNCTYGE